jgi:translation elongation factor EF-4
MQTQKIGSKSVVIQKLIDIDSAADAPDKDKSEYFMEPMAICTIVAPHEFLRELKSLCESRRGAFIE